VPSGARSRARRARIPRFACWLRAVVASRADHDARLGAVARLLHLLTTRLFLGARGFRRPCRGRRARRARFEALAVRRRVDEGRRDRGVARGERLDSAFGAPAPSSISGRTTTRACRRAGVPEKNGEHGNKALHSKVNELYPACRLALAYSDIALRASVKRTSA